MLRTYIHCHSGLTLCDLSFYRMWKGWCECESLLLSICQHSLGIFCCCFFWYFNFFHIPSISTILKKRVDGNPLILTCILSPALLYTACLSLEQSHTAQCRTYNKGIVCLRSVTPAPLLGQVMIFQGLNLPLVIMEDLQPSAAGASVLPCIFVCLCVCACVCVYLCTSVSTGSFLSSTL